MSIYGPFHSRRLGLSLGVDILPIVKTCTFDCVYCEIGPTYEMGFSSIDKEIFLEEKKIKRLVDTIEDSLRNNQHTDSITIGYNGEPTLIKNLGQIIKEIISIRDKIQSNAKVSIFTNSSTILNDRVKQDLALSEQVIAKLDAGNAESFSSIDKIHPSVPKLDDIIQHLAIFNNSYKKHKLIIQTMLIDGKFSNSKDRDIQDLTNAYNIINPDYVHLYTIARTPADSRVLGINYDQLESIKKRIVDNIDLGKNIKFQIFD